MPEREVRTLEEYMALKRRLDEALRRVEKLEAERSEAVGTAARAMEARDEALRRVEAMHVELEKWRSAAVAEGFDSPLRLRYQREEAMQMRDDALRRVEALALANKALRADLAQERQHTKALAAEGSEEVCAVSIESLDEIKPEFRDRLHECGRPWAEHVEPFPASLADADQGSEE